MAQTVWSYWVLQGQSWGGYAVCKFTIWYIIIEQSFFEIIHSITTQNNCAEMMNSKGKEEVIYQSDSKSLSVLLKWCYVSRYISFSPLFTNSQLCTWEMTSPKQWNIHKTTFKPRLTIEKIITDFKQHIWLLTEACLGHEYHDYQITLFCQGYIVAL